MKEELRETTLTLHDYLIYATKGFVKEPLIFAMSTTVATFLTYLADRMSVNLTFVSVYMLLSMADWGTGILASRIEQQQFRSGLFFKKPFLIGFCLGVVYMMQLMITAFSNYPHTSNTAFEAILEVTVTLMEIVKMGLLISFVIYELTSLRENFLRLKLYDFVKVVDIVLIPIQKINRFLVSKFDSIVEEGPIQEEPIPQEEQPAQDEGEIQDPQKANEQP